MVPVFFALMGFAVDLGRMYSARSELKNAANAMALAAAQRLIGTDQSVNDATAAAQQTIESGSGFGNKYDFGALGIGQTNGFLASSADDPAYYATLQDALQAGDSAGGGGGADSRHARAVVRGDVPLIFWSFLPLAQDRKVHVTASAVAGISAPLCTACGIEPFAVTALDPSDTVDFGFTANTRYTLAYLCNGIPTPAPLPNTTRLISYIILNRYDTSATLFPDEASQLYRMGANGLPGNPSSAQGCFSINATEQVWASAVPLACSLNRVPTPVQNALCGVAARFDSVTASTAPCAGIPEIDTLSTIYQPDSDATDIDDYASYQGNGRRVITIPVVDQLTSLTSMQVLGFRQFLVEPLPNTTGIQPGDLSGRFGALYLGSVAPVKQGRFDGCQTSAGPGKVVLHQ